MLKRHFIVLFCLATLSPAQATEYLDPKVGWRICADLLPQFFRNVFTRRPKSVAFRPGPYNAEALNQNDRFPTDKPIVLIRKVKPKTNRPYVLPYHYHRLRGRVIEEDGDSVIFKLEEDAVEVIKHGNGFMSLESHPLDNEDVQGALNQRNMAHRPIGYDLFAGKKIRVWKKPTDSGNTVGEHIVHWQIEEP